MAEEFELPEDLSDGDRLEAEGWFHFMVMEVDENPTKASGELIDGTRFTLQVLSGNVGGQKGKVTKQTLRNGNLSHKDGGKFRQLCKARMALALDLIRKDNAGQRVTINWQQAVGRQCIALLKKSDTDYLEIDGPKIYHVTDPAVAAVPKDLMSIQKFMGIDPATLPKPGDGTATTADAKAAGTTPAASKPTPAAKPAAAAATTPAPARQAAPTPQPAAAGAANGTASNPNAWDL